MVRVSATGADHEQAAGSRRSDWDAPKAPGTARVPVMLMLAGAALEVPDGARLIPRLPCNRYIGSFADALTPAANVLAEKTKSPHSAIHIPNAASCDQIESEEPNVAIRAGRASTTAGVSLSTIGRQPHRPLCGASAGPAASTNVREVRASGRAASPFRH
jgi:hypothetical protein